MLVLSSLVLLAALFKHSVLCEDTCKCVGQLQEQKGPCADGVCHTLMDYAAFQGNFSSNTTFKFLPGDHVLKERYISVTRVHNLKFIGLQNDTDHDDANVRCIGRNAGFFFENIEYLTITNMGFKHCGFLYFKNYTQAVLMRYVKNLQLSHVVIHNSSGYGLITYNLQGNSSIDTTTIDSSHNETGYFGGNLRIQYRNYSAIVSHYLVITNSNFQNGKTEYQKDNTESYASGIDILLATTESIYITLRNVTLTGNRARSGGNLALTYIHLTQSTTWPSSVVIDNCTLSSGSAILGGGMYMSMVARQNESTAYNHSVVIVHIRDTYIQNNEADVVGAGMYIQLYEEVALSTGANITIERCHFLSNTIKHLVNGRGGVALSILNFQIPDYLHHRMPQYTISVTSCNFFYNSVTVLSDDSVGSGTLFVEENAITVLKDNVFAHNHCTGIVAVRSNLKLQSNTTIWNNTGNNGGGMVLCDNSLLYLSGEVTVNITQNTALSYGGGIYAEFECTQAIPPCFFQIDQVKNKKVYLEQNSAKAGKALYGGSIEYCYLFGIKETNSTRFFFNIFNITPNDPSSISSNPLRVCFCHPNSQEKNCSLTQLEYNIYPGGILTVRLVVVGQRNGTVPGVVVASNVPDKHKTQSLENNQCKNLTYSLSSNATRNFTDKVFIDLTVQNTDFRDVIDSIHNVTISVNLMSCPPGFDLQVNHTEDQYGCMCSKILKMYLDEIECDIRTTSIHKSLKSSWWLGFQSTDNGSEIVFSKFCPFDYCDMKNVYINVSQPESADKQCAFKREGPLCGGCKKNLSMVFGSFHCADCSSNHSVLRVLGRIVLFSILGIVFVFILGILDITVTEGTLNAMIFYMNVVSMNRSIFIGSPNNRIVKLLEMFVELMNLTSPFEFCFYDGMDSFVKTILLFLFPLYLLFLAGVIIFLCRKSPLVSKIVGENAVKILATMILFSYAKILRVVIDSANHTTLNYSNGSTYVWSIDGNIQFWGKKHAFLFACAILIAAITLPYTLALLFIQCLRKRSDMKVLFWVNKLKPFFDAYTGPYKDNYHFWTGFLLIVRIILFVSIATNTSKGPILNLTLIGTTTSVLLILIKPGLYKKWQLTAIEAYTYFNLIVFSFGTAYVITDTDSKEKPTVICIGSMFLLFCGVVIYHVYKKFSDTQWWGKMKVWLLDKRWPWMKRKPIRSLILNHSGVDELSSSDSELDPILGNAPPVVRYDEYREPLVETGEYM